MKRTIDDERRRRGGEPDAEAREAAPAAPEQLAAAQLLGLQRSAGNQAVLRALGKQAIQRAPLFRGMQASAPNGVTPLLGNDAGYQLGVRDGEFQLNGANVVPGSGGASTANVRNAVPDFTASKSYPFGSHNTTNQNTQPFRWVWEIDDAALPNGLVTRNDHHNHVHIEAGVAMTPAQFRNLVRGTQAQWTRSDPP